MNSIVIENEKRGTYHFSLGEYWNGFKSPKFIKGVTKRNFFVDNDHLIMINLRS
jgi:hypothetical protein